LKDRTKSYVRFIDRRLVVQQKCERTRSAKEAKDGTGGHQTGRAISLAGGFSSVLQ
jgi:hypothetical protein